MDDDTILYAVGRHMVLRKLESGAMTFVHEAPAGVTQLTAMTISSDRRHVVVCERWVPSPGAAPLPRVRVVHVSGKKTVSTLNAAVEGAYVACAFSEDGKHVLAYTGAPENVVVVWKWADERPVGMLRSKTAIGRARFNPGASTLLSISAPMRICRLSEKGHFKEIEVGALRRYGESAVDHEWLSATRLVMATATGSVLVFNDGSLQQELPELGFVPRCVCAYTSSDGGGSANAAVAVVVVAAAAATGGGGGGGGTVGEAASGACPYRSAALRGAWSWAQPALRAWAASAARASGTWLGLGLG